MPLLRLSNVTKAYANSLHINAISFHQPAGQKLAIAGESGAGKTTLLKMIAGMVQPDSGEILFEGKKVVGPDEKLLPGHPGIGYLSQHYELLNNYRVEELIWFENKLSEVAAARLMEICRIQHLLLRKTNQLSGGEKQRIALCMLLIKSPRLLLLDEPFSNLDPIHTNILKAVLGNMANELGITLLLTSHEPTDTLPWADHILVMKDGQIVQQGKPGVIYHEPVNEYVAGMFGKYNLISPQLAAKLKGNKGIELNGMRMIRPEDFILCKNDTDGAEGMIQKISFFGSYYEAAILVDNTKIVTGIISNELKEGERVYVCTKV